MSRTELHAQTHDGSFHKLVTGDDTCSAVTIEAIPLDATCVQHRISLTVAAIE